MNSSFQPTLTATTGAGALVIEDNQILLVQPNYGRAKGAWILPGGYIESGETPETCALRELFEETGQQGQIVRPLCVRYRKSPQDIYWVFVTRRLDTSSPLRVQTEELQGACFWNIETLLQSPEVRPMTRFFVQGLLGQEGLELPEEFRNSDQVYFF